MDVSGLWMAVFRNILQLIFSNYERTVENVLRLDDLTSQLTVN